MKGDKVVGIFPITGGRDAIVRYATEDDLKDIFAIIQDRRFERSLREGEKMRILTNAEKATWLPEIQNPGKIVLVVETNNIVCGLIDIGKHSNCGDDTALVYSIAVLTSHRNKKLGRALLVCGIQEATDQLKVHSVELWATLQNIHAVNLYRSLGFQQKGEILPNATKWNRQPADRINMVKQFSS